MRESIPAPWPSEAIFEPGRPPVAVNRHRLPPSVRSHSHEFAELALIAAGSARHVTAAGESELRAGDLVALPPGAWHGYRACRGAIVVDCCVGTALLRRELGWARREPTLAPVLGMLAPEPAPRAIVVRLAPDQLQCVERAFMALQASLASPRPATVVARLIEALDAVAAAAPASPRVARAPVPPLVAHGLRLLESDLAHPWTLVALASQLRIDRSYLVRRFSDAAGSPPMAHLARRRAERAAELLDDTDWPVARVGAAVGWPHPHHFARRFRRHHGMSPTGYRARSGP